MGIKLLSHVNSDGDLIESWFNWYLRLGVDRFHLVVHGSKEDNRRLLDLRSSYPVVIEDMYQGAFDCEQKKRRLDAVLGKLPNQWVMVADSDEFVEFPYADIERTIQKLEFARATVMVAPMLQRLKSDGSLDSPPIIDDPFATFPICSVDLYRKMGSNAYLQKYPLFFCTEHTELFEEGNHSPPRGSEVRTSAMRGVTHHFKFRRSVTRRLESMIQNDAHPWRHESVQFREYLDTHAGRLPLDDTFPYSRQELFRRGLLRKLSMRNRIKAIGRLLGVVDGGRR